MSGVRCEVPFSLLKLLLVWTIVLIFAPTMSGYNWNGSPQPSPAKTRAADHSLAPQPPAFDDILIREIDATEGETLLLPCTVSHLGDKVVSWIRSKDLHILTSGRLTFSSDTRFESVHSNGSAGDFWGLRIRGVHVSDTGQYECQVNTDPKMSLAIVVTVSVSGVRKLEESSNSKWVSQALIKGPSEVYVQNGSPVTFTCEISPLSVASLQSAGPEHGLFFFSTPKPRVRWLHGDQEISSEFHNALDKYSIRFNQSGYIVYSTLHIFSVSWLDSGQYTCMQPSAKPDTIKLFVVEGEHSEAMQRDFPISSIGHTSKSNFCTLLISIFCILNY